MSDEIDFEFDTATFDELRESLEKVAKRYPDYAEKELKKEGREFSWHDLSARAILKST